MGQFFHWVFGEDWGVRSVDGYARPDSHANRDAIARFALVMAGGFQLVGLVLLIAIWIDGADVPGLNVGQSFVAELGGFAALVPLWWAFHRLPIGWLHILPVVASGMIVGIGLGLGPTLEIAVVMAVVIVEIIVSVSMRLRAGLVHISHMGAGLAWIMARNGGPVPVARWVGTMGGAVIVATVVEWMVGRTRALALAEHAASAEAERARGQLVELNRTLEARVAEQVADLERLGELQRFLPAPLVDAVLSGDQSLLQPHRAEIAVFFCDLRGFTSFAAASQPEDVHELLDAYFALLGEHAAHHGATVGAFTGDRLMAFFNDPLPVADPAQRALDLAVALRTPMDELLAPSRRVGHDIGFGVGIALGYANIGMIGFEGRRDYTALGPVVNVAARLCAEAPPGGILLDPRARVAVEGSTELGDPILVHLKGFERTIEAVLVAPPA